jgi:putative spermidine/putrescine transport system substrate-binding protein
MRRASVPGGVVVSLVALSVLAACGGSTTVSPSPEASAIGSGSTGALPGGPSKAGPVGQGEGQLDVLAWPGYAEDGSNNPAVDWVTDFEKLTGCTVNVQTIGTSDEAVELMQAGGWDVVSASGDATLRLINADYIQPLNVDLVPNYADVVADLKGKSFNSINGVPYGVPQGRGANILMWNTQKVPVQPDSWSVVFDEDSPYKGAVTAYDSPIYIADAAVYLMATRPELGITDPYSLDREQFDAAISLLEQQRELIGEYWSDYARTVGNFVSGQTAIGSSWEVIVSLAEAQGGKVAAIKPKEGVTGWSDTWMIAKDSAHVNCAYMWLDHVISPEVNAVASEWFGQAPANSKACEFTTDLDFCTTFHAQDSEYWRDVYYWATPSTSCLDGRTEITCVPWSEWVSAWSRLRA